MGKYEHEDDLSYLPDDLPSGTESAVIVYVIGALLLLCLCAITLAIIL